MSSPGRGAVPPHPAPGLAVPAVRTGGGPPRPTRRPAAVLPGLGVCLAGALVAWLGAQAVPGASALLLAILGGAVWRNVARVPAALCRGVAFSSRRLLRTGIVLLGFQLSLSAILDLGLGILLVVVLSVTLTFLTTLWVGRLLGVGPAQRLLVAAGFSICGAAAVTAVEGAAPAEEEEVATAVALVVLFGTLVIPLVPFLGGLLGLPEEMTGLWIGASTHEVAQVVAAGGAVGGGALAVAVTVKLARVITLAPIIAGISIVRRHRGAAVGERRPPIVPLFVVGFLAAMLVRSAGVLPEALLSILQVLQTLLLAAAMFALGLGVHLPSLVRVGPRPMLLGVASTTVILLVSLAGILVLGSP
ncbi:YeiH family protein [Citricoccus sp. SGAir0253]|uniref:YeiH family protein n=1 Tax=Citricoccus sp. SGAir0253 TaxID=2567881 RepID=UPI00352B4FAD